MKLCGLWYTTDSIDAVYKPRSVALSLLQLARRRFPIPRIADRSLENIQTAAININRRRPARRVMT